MVDHGLSKGVILIPCNKDIDTKEVAELFSNTSSCVLDYMIISSQIVDRSSHPRSPGNWHVSLDMI